MQFATMIVIAHQFMIFIFYRQGLIINQQIQYCNKLFFLEKQFRDLTPEERKDRCLETEVPVWESFYAWLEQLNPVKRSKLEKAVIYAKKHKETV